MTARGWAVASGHPATTEAAVEVLAVGGNAIDACVAAGFAASIAEPTLTSLGGGGFLLARTAEGEEVVFDFFVDTPGRPPAAGPAPRDVPLDFAEVVVRFSGADQSFHVGLGSVAAPGCLAGWLHAHRRLGRLDLDEVVAPARRLAETGVVVNEQQAYLLRILEPILTRTPEVAAIVAPAGRLLGLGDRMANPDLAAFLASLDERGFARPGLATRIDEAMRAGGGLLTRQDIEAYEVCERAPLEVRWRGHRLLTNPPPSFGGELVALGLLLLEERPGWPAEAGSADHAVALAEAMVATDDARARGVVSAELARRRASGGTTHVSVRDSEGAVATMTTSNGEGSGWVIPGTGVMANNMMGEDDLHPGGFHLSEPGHRVASMMAPTVVVGPDGAVELVLGSGGSKRIRTALLQVLAGVIDQGRDLAEVVEAPRLHWDGDELHVEPGWGPDALAALSARFPVRRWEQRDLFFGGVHAVAPGAAAGDPRRGGSARAG
ncbi:MAG: gamma-glutamyltransferase family protein [Actinomycetota bacterium]